jgi:hypothetical protein
MSLTSCPSSISVRPMVRRGARLHRHHARRQLGEKRDQLAAREFARHNDFALRVDRVNLKHPLAQIETNPRDSRQIPDRLAHRRLPFRWGFDNDHLGTLMPFGGAPRRPPHHPYRARHRFTGRSGPRALAIARILFGRDSHRARHAPSYSKLLAKLWSDGGGPPPALQPDPAEAKEADAKHDPGRGLGDG